jgi:hypothetical protein
VLAQAHAGKIQHQDRDQHQHAADQRVQEKLDRRVLAPRAAPDADQEVHGQQYDFPEHVEQEEIQGQKDSQHARFQQQEQDAVRLDVPGHRPTSARRQQADQRGQHDQRHADPVGPHEILDPERRDPRHVKDVLHVRRRFALVVERAAQRREERQYGHDEDANRGPQGDVPYDFLFFLGDAQHQHGAQHREEHDRTQHHKAGSHHRSSIFREKGTVPFCAKHPPGRSGNRGRSPVCKTNPPNKTLGRN